MSEESAPDKQLTKRQTRLAIVTWVGISSLVVLCVFLASDFSQASEVEPEAELVSPQSPVPSPAQVEVVSEFGYGIQVQAESGDAATIVNYANRLGLNWIKQQVRWSSMQPTPDEEPYWMWLDSFIAQANASGLKVLLSIVAAPDWTRNAVPPDKTGPPDDLQAYADFVTAVLERYPGQIHAIEVWNEQNLQREWYTAGGLSAARYVEMLSLTYETVKAIDPNVIVVSGALSPTGVNDGVTAIDDFDYMDQMIKAGLLDYADCIGAHHTGVNLPPNVTAEEAFEAGAPPDTVFLGPYNTDNPLNPHHSWSFRSTLRGQYEKIVAAGGTQRLCVTEFGWPSMEGLGAEEAPPDFEFAWDNSLEEQADYIVQAYQLLREWDIAQMAFLWNLDFASNGEEEIDDNMLYSILLPDGTVRPAFNAIATMPKN